MEAVEAYRRNAIAEHPDWSERTVQTSTATYARGIDNVMREQTVALVLRLRSAN